MTVQELYDSVALLGFDTNIEYVNAFYFAANRAILEVCKIRPVLATLLINHYPLKNSVNKDVYHYDGKTEYIVSATDSKAFYFECDGNGDVYVENKPVNASQWQTLKHIALQSKRQFIANKEVATQVVVQMATTMAEAVARRRLRMVQQETIVKYRPQEAVRVVVAQVQDTRRFLKTPARQGAQASEEFSIRRIIWQYLKN